MISRTLAMACGVKIRGTFFLVSCAGVAVAVAIVSPRDEELLPVLFNCTVLQAGIQARFTVFTPFDAAPVQ
jgi:hypothetical protein